MIAKTLVITTSNFDMTNPLLAELAGDGWMIARNVRGRRLTETEVSALLHESEASVMVAGVEELTDVVFEANPQLRVISRCGSGLDAVDVAAARRRGIIVVRTPEAPAESVAELTIGLAIAVLRRVVEADRNLRAGAWQALMGTSLGRSRVGIVGLGHVGSRVAGVATVLGSDVAYFDKFVLDAAYRRFPSVQALAHWADVLTIHLPHDRETHHTVSAPVLEALGPAGVLINTARGGLVDEVALVEALSRGTIAGAALDVFEDEPYDGPLIGMDHVVLTCHMGSYSQQVRAAMETEALANAIAAIRSLA